MITYCARGQIVGGRRDVMRVRANKKRGKRRTEHNGNARKGEESENERNKKNGVNKMTEGRPWERRKGKIHEKT